MKRLRKETPVGRLEIEVGNGEIVRCHWIEERGNEQESFELTKEEEELSRQISEEIENYFAGKLQTFTLPIRLEGSAFEMQVWNELVRIPYGEVITYGEVARRVGKPGASRAVGMACKKNPIGIIVPCHRVVAKGGKMGGYNGGLDKKNFLLDLESKNRNLFKLY